MAEDCAPYGDSHPYWARSHGRDPDGSADLRMHRHQGLEAKADPSRSFEHESRKASGHASDSLRESSRGSARPRTKGQRPSIGARSTKIVSRSICAAEMRFVERDQPGCVGEVALESRPRKPREAVCNEHELVVRVEVDRAPDVREGHVHSISSRADDHPIRRDAAALPGATKKTSVSSVARTMSAMCCAGPGTAAIAHYGGSLYRYGRSRRFSPSRERRSRSPEQRRCH